MARFLKKQNTKLGAAPGALVFVGKQRVEKVNTNVLIYNSKEVKEFKKYQLREANFSEYPNYIKWYNIVGLHKSDIINQYGIQFKIHNLTQEDILNTSQRPKFEEHEEYLFIVLKVLHFDTKLEAIDTEQISFIITTDTLITFQEIEEDVFNPIRDRLLRPTTKIRHRNSDYLAFALLDTIIDHYIFVIERFGEGIEKLENELLDKPTNEHLQKIHAYKKEINFLRKTIRPVRELISSFIKSESELINEDTFPFLKDLDDHIIQATEAIEIYKDMLNDQLDIYNSAIGNKLNDIMRVLTIFSVVFIPLTFLAGIYGTNFEYLPELKFRYAYPIFWIVMIVVAVGMIAFFKKRKWL